MGAALAPVWRVMSLWRGRLGWLIAGGLVTLAAIGTALGLMGGAGLGVAGAMIGGAIAAPLLFRLLGPARIVLRYFERLLTHEALFRALADLRVWFFRGLAGRSAGGLGYRRAGDVLARLVNDVEALDGLYLRIALPLLGVCVLLPVLVLVLGGWQAALVGTLFAVASLLLPFLAARATLAAGGRLASAQAGLRNAALDALTGLREVRAFAAEGRMLAQVQAREAGLIAAQHEIMRRGAWAAAGAFVCAQLALLAVLAGAGPGAASAGAVLVVVAAFEVAAGLSRAGVLAGHAAASAARVVEAADGAPPVPDPTHPAPLPTGSGLRFDAVGFRYADTAPFVLDGLSLDIPQGAHVALLGPSGAGKSTLAALALKIAAPQHGRVLLGGVDIATLDAAALRSRIAYLSQTTHLFDDTIRANLALARPDASEPEMWAALEAARIADAVRALPDGLDAIVGEAGGRFSGGQGRRLALARAFLSPAPVLILDEPCAGLDADTERDFFTTLNNAPPGRTLLLIAHRLTGVERLDRIYRLSAGRAVAAAG
jgi:ATP-binding cassette subfamily C protein CydC